MPLIPEAIVTLLAAAKLGVTFTVVFSGFSAEALSSRMNDLGARRSGYRGRVLRRGKKILLKEIVDKALEQTPTVEHVIVVGRLGEKCAMRPGSGPPLLGPQRQAPGQPGGRPECTSTATHPLYVLYTSGTTGKPKGMIHDTGGYAVLLHATMNWVFDIQDSDVYWCPADIGWVTGHSYVAFGPLIEGATSVIYEGTLDFPQPDRWWSIVERYRVSIFYTTPTATRTQMKFGDDYLKKHDMSSLRIDPQRRGADQSLGVGVALREGGRQEVPRGSTWWMTETGGILVSHLPGLMLIPDETRDERPAHPRGRRRRGGREGRPVEPGKKGYIVIKNPWPGMPGPPTGMWGDPERFEKVYYSRFPGTDYFFCGDYAVKDKDGYIWVVGRADEVLKVAGHRLGTYEIESAIVSHPAASEAAVVGVADPVKGEVPIAFVVLRQGHTPDDKLRVDIKRWVRSNFSPIAEPSNVFFVNKLPKTRSGKIMRRLVKAVAEGKPLGDIATLEDEASVTEVREAYENLRVT